MPVSVHSGSPSTGEPNTTAAARCVDRHDRERARQQMEPVVRQPHPEAERHERVREVDGDLRDASAADRRPGPWRRPLRHQAARTARRAAPRRTAPQAPALPRRPRARSTTTPRLRDRLRSCPNAFKRLPNVNTTASAAMSHRCANRPIPDRRPLSASSAPGTRAGQRDVVVRAGVHAVEAERAVHVADLRRQEQPQLAATLPARRRAPQARAVP